MDKSKKEIVYSIMEGLNSYNISDDTVFDEDHISYQVDAARVSLIKEEWTSHKLGETYYQGMECIKVECHADGCYIKDFGYIKSGDVTYFAEIPGLIPFINYDEIKYLGEIGWRNNFHRVPFSTFIKGVTGIWTAGKPIYTVMNSKVLFRNLPSDGIKRLSMLAILETPENACEFDYKTKYPVSDPLKIEIIVIKNLLSRLGINFKDKNDASPDIQPAQNKPGK